VADRPSPEKRLLEGLRHNWSAFSKSLASVEQHPQFNDFLSQYRGHAESVPVESREPLRAFFLAHWKSSFIECFNQAALTAEDLSEEFLKEFEASFNMVVHYWLGRNDRNFQFRTVVHFLGLADAQFAFEVGEGRFSFRVSEWGLSFSQRGLFDAFPRRHSLARVCGVSSFVENAEPSLPDEQKLFRTIRILQREFCLLMDEWEHCNSILAVKQFSIRKLHQTDPEQGQAILMEIASVRNALARWCVRSAADFQKFIARLGGRKSLHADVAAELSALDSLVLAGFQKFLLPASVSRHVYSNDVLIECLNWVDARLEIHPDDLFSLIGALVFHAALNREGDANALCERILGRSFEWTLSADPSAALKSVCWGLTRFEHRFFSAALVVVLDSKLAPSILDSHWLQTLASVVEMPGTFPLPDKTISDLKIASDNFEKIQSRAVSTLERCCAQSRDEALQAARFVLEFLRSDPQTDEDACDEGDPS